jgi:hypothetical protein
METPLSQESSTKKTGDFGIADKNTSLGGSIHSSHSSIEEGEVFAVGEDGVDFRTVGWIRGRSWPLSHLYCAD